MNSVAKGALITIATGLLVGVLVVVFEHATHVARRITRVQLRSLRRTFHLDCRDQRLQ